MAQQVREHHQSDFPIFEYLDKANPARAIKYWKEARRSTRWSLAAMVASFVLAGIVVILTRQGVAEIHEASLPKLSEALIAPYERESRPFPLFIPGDNIELLLPPTVGNFTRFVEQPVDEATSENTDAESIEIAANNTNTTTDVKGIDGEAAALTDALDGAVDSETTIAVEAPAETVPEEPPLPIIANQAANCLLGINPPLEEGDETGETVCGFTSASQMVATANYHHDGRPVQLTVARFEDEVIAEQTVLNLFRYNRRVGEVGNYAILDVRPVDWYFSLENGQFGFVWSNGTYIYAVHATNFRDLEDFVEELQF
ncbi:MAG: hypothetical protein D6737_06005 [Chloroflexi bacterium]|nr:MAG: hypothetical protein D6737_06005 [Chloroflexota bacterium]